MQNQNTPHSPEHASNAANPDNSTASLHSSESTLGNPAASLLLKFSVPRIRVALVTAGIFWATEDWFTDQAIEPNFETITVHLAPDTLSLPDVAWVLSNLPDCLEAALHVAPVAAYTGDPKRAPADLKRPPCDATIKRCMSGAIAFIDLIEGELNAAIEATALMQFGLDINEACAEGNDDRAERLRDQSLTSRGAKAWALLKKLRTTR